MTNEIIIMWMAVTLYALSAIGLILGFVFEKPKVVSASLWIVAMGVVAHGVGIGIRWARVGHGPYLGFYEVVSSFAFASALIYLVLAWRRPSLRIVGRLGWTTAGRAPASSAGLAGGGTTARTGGRGEVTSIVVA